MSLQSYLITYDISDPKRLRKVFEAMRDIGDHIQFSVFRCELTASALVELRDRLGDIINHSEDQVLVVDLGPSEGRGGTCIGSIGRAYTPPRRRAIII